MIGQSVQIILFERRQNPRLRLLCFPYAGGTAGVFRTWPYDLPFDIELYALDLPGRVRQFRQPAFDRLAPLVDSLNHEVRKLLDKPLALFGHSMGALIAFELARKLQARHGINPCGLFVSGRPAPQTPYARRWRHDLPETEFLNEVARLGGIPPEFMRDLETIRSFLPVLRADFAVSETYAYTAGPRLECPVTAFGGLQDSEVTLEQLEAWREQTNSGFSLHMFNGDHFFINTCRERILEIITHELQNARCVKRSVPISAQICTTPEAGPQ